MGVSRNSDNKIVMNGWAGLNESYAPAHLRPGDLAAVSNMQLVDGIALSSRLGQTPEHDRVFYPNQLGVKRILHYKSLSGVKKRLVIFGNNLRVAHNTAFDQYENVVTIPGTPWLLQYYDVVLFGSDQQDMGVYDPISGTVAYPYMNDFMPSFMFANSAVTVTSTTGGYLLDGHYAYRFTYDISVGGVFLGETGATGAPNVTALGDTVKLFAYALASFSSATNTNCVQFKRPDNTYVNLIPSYVSAINVYRTPSLTADVFTTDPSWDVKDDFTVELCGSIDVATMRAAAVGATIFTDSGAIFGKLIRRTSLLYAPRSKRVAMHKGRLVMSSPRTRQNGETTYDYAPDQIAWCENGENGTEPLVFFPESTIALGAGEPEEMTVIKSIRQQVLGVCKEDKTFVLLGGDSELLPGIPDFSPQLIDGNTGCDAPDSVVEIDGGAIMFKSERGVMEWRGAAPQSVAYDRIKKTFARIPGNRKRYAVSEYNPKEKRYRLVFTLPEDNGYNRSYIEWNQNNNSWVAGKLQRGVSATCWVNDADAEGYMLWGIEDNPFPTFISTPWVMRADSGFKEGIDANTSQTEQIHFSVDIGYQDGGTPWLRKQWKEVVVEFEAQVPISLEVWVDNKGPFSQQDLSPPTNEDDLIWGVGAWGEKKWRTSSFGTSRRVITSAIANLPKGSSVRCILSGVNVYSPVKVYSVTVYYTPEES